VPRQHRSLQIISAAAASVFTLAAGAAVVTVNLNAPTFDQWSYPFANSPGSHPYAAVFGGVTSAGLEPDFDNRDGQLLIGFNTASAGVTPQLNPWRYTVHYARVRLTVETNDTFSYDPTPDSYRIWLPPNDPEYQPDLDPGHSVDLFGTGFRHGFTVNTYGEHTPYSPLGAFGRGIRSAYPIAFRGGRCVDASNNVTERFDPVPFAVGMNPALTPGQLVPVNTVLTFDINVNDPDINRYLRRSLKAGMLDFNVTGIFAAEQQQGGTYPRFYTKENLAVIFGFVQAARLEMSVTISDNPWPQGDVNGDGIVNVNDLLAVINAWGPCPCCAADVNEDGVVNVNDLLLVINTWGA
jgi:hypothetical protein